MLTTPFLIHQHASVQDTCCSPSSPVLFFTVRLEMQMTGSGGLLTM